MLKGRPIQRVYDGETGGEFRQIYNEKTHKTAWGEFLSGTLGMSCTASACWWWNDGEKGSRLRKTPLP